MSLDDVGNTLADPSQDTEQRIGCKERGKVNYDNAVQRNLMWDVEKKSLLIHSMIYGHAIPAMYFTRAENGIYDSLDGKQRSNAISEFLRDEFALSADTLVAG